MDLLALMQPLMYSCILCRRFKRPGDTSVNDEAGRITGSARHGTLRRHGPATNRTVSLKPQEMKECGKRQRR
ncbi:hypothetical protein J6590_012022 [Homalodisca vitripennis]|nr:hypothetical protein J6590_012022 [Homalodisca vitripennis]